MFRKILIANRGEIACRVIKTVQRLGISTVAIYSDADASAAHVGMADEAVRIGAAAVSESYLRGDKIIAAAKATGAEAIHPGYGFLSENPDFVEAVEAADLHFIGPPASAIRAMGLKDAAKALMQKHNVPVVPGYHGAEQDAAVLAREAEEIGYPVLIKARAGGGGKGMRRVDDPDHFVDALAAAQREGQNSFGDPVCLIEKYISKPRHIEIQIFADGHGNVVHLFERDCSLQRRHQKVIEEAPAPDMPEAVRTAMGKAATDAALAIEYEGAGTVEFIVDGSGPLRQDGFWFMEMNTRLQVEHPVTEAITGLDLVEWQLRIAFGAPLPVKQEDLAINGWAFEARLYAEDVPKGFLPATGALAHFATPRGVAFENGTVRIDSGVREGDAISPWYDPMIAKVITHAPDRASALNLLSRTLGQVKIAGCVTNRDFLIALSRDDEFKSGHIDTDLIARKLGTLTQAPPADAVVRAVAAIATLGLLPPQPAQIGWRAWGTASHRITLFEGPQEDTHTIEVLPQNRFRSAEVTLFIQTSPGGYVVETDNNRHNLSVSVHGAQVTVFTDSQTHVFTKPDPLDRCSTDNAQSNAIIAPMPGLVSDVRCKIGLSVSKGQTLLVLEAMKMEHQLSAPRDGKVLDLLCTPGDQVSDGTLLLKLEPEDD